MPVLGEGSVRFGIRSECRQDVTLVSVLDVVAHSERLEEGSSTHSLESLPASACKIASFWLAFQSNPSPNPNPNMELPTSRGEYFRIRHDF